MIKHSTAFSGRALSNGASMAPERNRISERPKAIKLWVLPVAEMGAPRDLAPAGLRNT
jgi:hypothetical protein